MNESSLAFKVATRSSRLAIIQTTAALERLSQELGGATFDIISSSSPGDRDQQTDLRSSEPDFFTRDLDQAVLAGQVDAALHSAKDLPDTLADGLDYFWLPWKEDPRDVILLPPGQQMEDLPADARFGVSSDRREEYIRRFFPEATLAGIRGNIEDRLRQLDEGQFDAIILAAAGLNRLGLSDRITETIPLADLPSPAGQGTLAVTFRTGDPRWTRIRSLFVKAVTFAGAGAGSAEMCTVAAVRAMQHCEVCLYDSLLDASLLDHLPASAQRVDVGKRCGEHRHTQADISQQIADFARRGLRVVRLKGGDPGLFGRLAEEIDTLESLSLPYEVIPGISSFQSATTGTGMLLTRRGVSRGFCVMTPRKEGGGMTSVAREGRADLPMVFFMATKVWGELAEELQSDGLPPGTPAAIIFGAGTDEQNIVRSTVGGLSTAVEGIKTSQPGLIIVGEVARYGFDLSAGALAGSRVLLTCSDALQERTAVRVRDFGGKPIRRPQIKLTATTEGREVMGRLDQYDWLVLTSPSSARVFLDLLREENADIRKVPKLLTCGPGTAGVLRKQGFHPEVATSDYGTKGLLQRAGEVLVDSDRVLRLRSEKAPPTVTDALTQCTKTVDDVIAYQNEAIVYDAAPDCDAIFFASKSSVDAFVGQHSLDALAGKTILTIGTPTTDALQRHGVTPDVVAAEATVESAIESLARWCVQKHLQQNSLNNTPETKKT